MFKFKLQAVLDHRQYIEDNLKKELSEIRSKVRVEEKQLELLKRKEMKTIQKLKQEQAAGLSSDQVISYQNYISRLFDRIAEQETLIETIRTEESEKQGEMIEAVKKRQILEKLKTQGLDRYRQTMLEKETKFIDELAVNQFVRKSIDHHGSRE